MTLRKSFLLFTLLFATALISCSKKVNQNPENPKIILIGEMHSEPVIISKELELWQHYYKEEGFRHLFIEIGYYQGLILNEWIHSDSNDLFARMFNDLEGTAFYTQEEVDFFKEIKRTCPNTVFHGTDIGHQYRSTGVWYLEHMVRHELKDTPEYKLAEENNRQGKEYYDSNCDEALRENYMVQNFIREYDALPENTKIMGIYGNAHVELNKKNFINRVNSMTYQLNLYYTQKFNEPIIATQDLSEMRTEREPESITTITIGDKEYTASCFGKSSLEGYIEGYKSRTFYRIESDKEDFKKCRRTLEHLPYDNYPTAVHVGDVYLIVYEKTNGKTEKRYYRADGKKKDSYSITNNIKVE